MPEQRPHEPRDWWWDLVPALPLLLFGLGGTGRAAENQDASIQAPDVLGYALVATAALALVLRRRAPAVALVGSGSAVAAYLALGYPFGPILLTGPAAVYAVATRLAWRPAVRWSAAFVAVTALAAAPRFFWEGRPGWLGYLIWTATWLAVVSAPAALGATVQVRRRSEAGVRAEQARRAVSEERLAMAQDVHDGVGHGLAVIALHAGVALHVLDRDTERVRELLGVIQATSRESLDGLRGDLDRLRSSAAPGEASRRPTPDVDDLPVLIARMRGGGLAVTAEVDLPATLPADVAATVYRIVQESLTNVLRHAGVTSAHVSVALDGSSVVVEVRDHGLGAPGAGPARPREPGPEEGSGIPGMRRRAATLGGRLDTGPAPGGGFLVRAELPVPAHSPAGTATARTGTP